MKIKWVLFIFVNLFFITIKLYAQADSIPTYRLELKDGSSIIGIIISENEQYIQFKMSSGAELKIQKDQIRKQTIISPELRQLGYFYKDPNRTRLFFSPTGKALKKGEGYFSVYEIFFPFLSYGITDVITLAGGFTLIPGADKQIVYLAPKITPVQTDNLSIAGGVLYLDIPDFSEGAGIVYGVGTFGGEKSAFTVGLGWGFIGGDFSNRPVLVVGTDIRLSNKLKLVSENWFIPGAEGSLLSFGLRFFGENLAADFGLLYPAGGQTEGFPFIPWIGFAYNFGSK